MFFTVELLWLYNGHNTAFLPFSFVSIPGGPVIVTVPYRQRD